MSEYIDQVTRELLALADRIDAAIDRVRLRLMLADAWEVGYAAGIDDMEEASSAIHAAPPPAVNPFAVGLSPNQAVRGNSG